jgi:hypothetical protein
LWFFDGKLWCFGWRFSSAENMPPFRALFSVFPLLGIRL